MDTIDLNCDLGDDPAAESAATASALLDVVTSVNIACGVHAGDALTVTRNIQLAVTKPIAIGAHPGLPDREGLGRRQIGIEARDVYGLVAYQVGALLALVRTAGGRLRHVKPHGALYNMAAVDRRLSDAIAAAVRDVDPSLALVGLCGSELLAAGTAIGLPTLAEAFADRRYEANGTLVPRRVSGAVIDDDESALAQAISIARDHVVRSRAGTPVALEADTLCLHGDGPHALPFARAIRNAIEGAGIRVKAPA